MSKWFEPEWFEQAKFKPQRSKQRQLLPRRPFPKVASLSAGFCLVAAQALASPLEGEGAPAAFYQIAVNEALSEVTVEARFAGEIGELEAEDGRLGDFRSLSGCGGERVRTRGDRLATTGLDGCLRYRYPLEAETGSRTPPVATGVRVTRPGAWLWTPDLHRAGPVHIELSLPAGAAVSVPWRPLDDGRYALDPSPGSATGKAVFGAFDTFEVPVAGASIRVAAVHAPNRRLDLKKTADWLGVALDDVAAVAGRFPNPNLQVIVHPVGDRGRSPVPFGYVIRDGGETVRFYVAENRSLEDFLEDWTATHEFAHLLLPYVRSREKWVSEGFASYYQNVLLARRGAYTEAEAWQRLHRSFRRAGDVRNPPRLDRLNERSFGEMRMLIYWSGAAFALMADTQLRAMGDGTLSLDSVLGQLADCCLPSARVWTAAALFERLDTFIPEPVFMPLYDEFMARRGMPDLDRLYAELGIETSGDWVRLTDEGRLRALRGAIMSPAGRSPPRRSTDRDSRGKDADHADHRRGDAQL